MRKKENNTASTSFGVTEGIDFTASSDTPDTQGFQEVKQDALGRTRPILTDTEIDPNRSYTPNYKPRPKKGPNGGVMGRGAIPDSERKIQFSISCTVSQKEAFIEAARKSKRSLPNFICFAAEEYMEEHGLK